MMVINISEYKKTKMDRLRNKYSELYNIFNNNKPGIMAVINYNNSNYKTMGLNDHIIKLVGLFYDPDVYIADAVAETQGFGDTRVYNNLGEVLGELSDILYNKEVRLKYLNILDNLEGLTSSIFFFLDKTLYGVGR